MTWRETRASTAVIVAEYQFPLHVAACGKKGNPKTAKVSAQLGANSHVHRHLGRLGS
jgi:hypothetical protein